VKRREGMLLGLADLLSHPVHSQTEMSP
jgi:hypothetical protein